MRVLTTVPSVTVLSRGRRRRAGRALSTGTLTRAPDATLRRRAGCCARRLAACRRRAGQEVGRCWAARGARWRMYGHGGWRLYSIRCSRGWHGRRGQGRRGQARRRVGNGRWCRHLNGRRISAQVAPNTALWSGRRRCERGAHGSAHRRGSSRAQSVPLVAWSPPGGQPGARDCARDGARDGARDTEAEGIKPC